LSVKNKSSPEVSQFDSSRGGEMDKIALADFAEAD